MPIISPPSLRPPFSQFNGHLQTILPAFDTVPTPHYIRERISTFDHDFLDLDWMIHHEQDSKSIVVILHGLEGNSYRPYMMSAAHYFYNQNHDIIAINSRSCSGSINYSPRLYDHGEINDLKWIINHILNNYQYQNIILLGFSMGGNILIKYIGTQSHNIPQQILTGIAISAPTHIKSSTSKLQQMGNFIYNKKFMKSLSHKIRAKAKQYPNIVQEQNLKKIKNWDDFMAYFNAPLNGYSNAEDFYTQANATRYIPFINKPILLINALNDPILTPLCSPKALAKENPLFYLSNPKNGGHVGFAQRNHNESWALIQAHNFILKLS